MHRPVSLRHPATLLAGGSIGPAEPFPSIPEYPSRSSDPAASRDAESSAFRLPVESVSVWIQEIEDDCVCTIEARDRRCCACHGWPRVGPDTLGGLGAKPACT